MTDVLERLEERVSAPPQTDTTEPWCITGMEAEVARLQARERELQTALTELHDAACRIWNSITSERDQDYDEDDVLEWLARPSDLAAAALAAVSAEKEGDPRLAFNGEDYCSLRNFISDARKEWTESGALTDEYLDALDEKVRQALIAHRAAVSAETEDS